MAYRITRGDFQARFDSLGRLTHLGHPDRIKDTPTCFHTIGPIREGHWHVNFGGGDVFFDPETTQRQYDFAAGTLTLTSSYRDPCVWWGFNLQRSYRIEAELLRCDFTLENWTPREGQGSQTQDGLVTSAAPLRRLRYCTGVNSWTDFSSDWAHRPYPTNLRVEKEFFWAGLITTAHDVVGYFTPGKTDSWQIVYEGHGMQRIRSASIDFVNSLDPHPRRVASQDVRLGASRPCYQGTYYVGRFDSMESLWERAAAVLGVAFACPGRCSGFVGEMLRLPVIATPGAVVTARVRDENQNDWQETLEAREGELSLPLRGQTGRKVLEISAGGKTTEARIWQHQGWADSLLAAARYAAQVKKPSGNNAESILGLVTLSQAAGLLGDQACRQAARRVLEQAFEVHYDRASGRHKTMHNRLQNYGSLLDAVRIYQNRLGDDQFLVPAQLAALQMMSLQQSDGNFYNHHNLYNNVIHPVKSLFDWGRHLCNLGLAAQGEAALASAERAYRNIARSGDDTGTEGSDHFEDGMTACAGYQIASMWPHLGRLPQDLAMAQGIYDRRRMLKARVPDSRYFGATLRHWEGYWAMGLGQCMLGGHGWNAWSASFAHALFMATGRWDYLLDAYATLCNCLQAVDLATGVYHFGFCVDPCWNEYFGLGTPHAGEEYLAIPDEITVACEQHSTFLTLDESFYRQVYVRLGPQGVEVLNGQVAEATPLRLELTSYALDLQEVVVAAAPGTSVPDICVRGKNPRVVMAG